MYLCKQRINWNIKKELILDFNTGTLYHTELNYKKCKITSKEYLRRILTCPYVHLNCFSTWFPICFFPYSEFCTKITVKIKLKYLILALAEYRNAFLLRTRSVDFVPHRLHWNHVRKASLDTRDDYRVQKQFQYTFKHVCYFSVRTKKKKWIYPLRPVRV